MRSAKTTFAHSRKRLTNGGSKHLVNREMGYVALNLLFMGGAPILIIIAATNRLTAGTYTCRMLSGLRRRTDLSLGAMKSASRSLFEILAPAIEDSFKKLNLRLMVKSPVMFATIAGASLTTIGIVTARLALRGFVAQLALWL